MHLWEIYVISESRQSIWPQRDIPQCIWPKANVGREWSPSKSPRLQYWGGGKETTGLQVPWGLEIEQVCNHLFRMARSSGVGRQSLWFFPLRESLGCWVGYFPCANSLFLPRSLWPCNCLFSWAWRSIFGKTCYLDSFLWLSRLAFPQWAAITVICHKREKSSVQSHLFFYKHLGAWGDFCQRPGLKCLSKEALEDPLCSCPLSFLSSPQGLCMQ